MTLSTSSAKKKRSIPLWAVAFWLLCWEAAARWVDEPILLVSPLQAIQRFFQLLWQPQFWQSVGFSLGHILLGFFLSLALALVLRTFVVQAFWIPSGSMIPTLEVQDRVLVAKFWYTFFDPRRGEVVVFKYPVDPTRDFVKRIVGLPGEVVSMQDGVVYVDGQAVDDSYVKNHDSFKMDSGEANPIDILLNLFTGFLSLLLFLLFIIVFTIDLFAIKN